VSISLLGRYLDTVDLLIDAGSLRPEDFRNLIHIEERIRDGLFLGDLSEAVA
jgi:hypothetical protein